MLHPPLESLPFSSSFLPLSPGVPGITSVLSLLSLLPTIQAYQVNPYPLSYSPDEEKGGTQRTLLLSLASHHTSLSLSLSLLIYPCCGSGAAAEPLKVWTEQSLLRPPNFTPCFTLRPILCSKLIYLHTYIKNTCK
eukprot:COSAG05_NODE_3171_length_2268_cov_2.619640_2_plen_136_part_00